MRLHKKRDQSQANLLQESYKNLSQKVYRVKSSKFGEQYCVER